MLLIFSKWSVGRLCVCSCLGRFFWINVVFLWSSIRVRVLLVGICLFLVLVCGEWKWISWTRNHVFHHGLAFSSLIFFVVLRKSMCISAFGPSSSLSNFFHHIVYPFGFFKCVLVAIFYSKIVRFLLHLVIGIFSCHLFPLVDRIFFRCFGMSCFFCIVLPFVDIYLIFLISPVLFSSCFVIFSCVAFSFLSLHVPASFLCFIILSCFRWFFICVSSRISHPGFDFFFVLFEGIPIFSLTNFAPA